MIAGTISITESPEYLTKGNEVLSELLVRTSRTFALAIPCLPFPTRWEVTIAYLLFRIADTIEDGNGLNRAEKLAALDIFSSLLRGDLPATQANLDLPRSPSDNPHYLALLDELPLVVNSLGRLRIKTRMAIIESTLTSLAGMRRFIRAGTADGQIQVKSVDELREYCFLVAGVVGEMLTEVFVEEASSLSGRPRLASPPCALVRRRPATGQYPQGL